MNRLTGVFGREARSSIKMVSGTSVGQIIPLLMYPVLTRMYEPVVFGHYTLLLTITACIVPMVTGCYDHAIILAGNRYQVLSIVRVIIRRLLLFLLFFILMAGVADTFHLLSADHPLATVLPWILPMVALNVVYLTSAECFIRAELFTGLAIVRAITGSGSAFFRSIAGFFGSSSSLMIGAEAFSKFIVSIVCFFYLIRYRLIRPRLAISSPQRILNIPRKFYKFPRLVLPEQLVNIIAGSIHVFIISLYFGAEEMGFVALIFSALYLPVTLITSAFKDIFKKYGNVQYNTIGTCRPLFMRFLLALMIIGGIGFGILFLVAQELFVIVFGSGWQKSADYAQLMVPMFFLNFISMAFSPVFIFSGKLTLALAWQIANLFIVTGALLIVATYTGSVYMTLAAYSAARSFIYLIYLALAYKYAGVGSRRVEI